jgi:hypothetical protein
MLKVYYGDSHAKAFHQGMAEFKVLDVNSSAAASKMYFQ